MAPTGGKSKRAKRGRPSLRVLFTCVGRRVELLRAFRRAGERLGIDLAIHGADVTLLSPAMHHVDRTHILPRVDDPGYTDALLETAGRRKIDLIIPLIDPELPVLAAAADRFADLGCLALVSSREVIATCQDKLATYRVLREAGICTPETWTWTEAISRKRHRYPLFLKPRTGSAAKGNHVIHNRSELETLGQRVEGAIVQRFIDGVEYTMDVYTGFDGRPRCVVPRRRLEVRTGEVSKAIIVKDKAIMALGRRVAEVLGSCRGVVTVQCIAPKGGPLHALEINPRFGGGVPLAIRAGADFPKWILAEALGRRPRIRENGFRDDIAMLRFDDSVFVENASKRKHVHLNQ